MARPSKRAGSNNIQFRKRVPTALLPYLRGKLFAVDLPDTTTPDSPTSRYETTISAEIVFSLRAPEGRLAAIRHAAALRHVEAFLEAASRAKEHLSHQDIQSILGVVYRDLVAKHEANPPALYQQRHDDTRDDTWSEFEEWTDIARRADELIFLGTPGGRRAAVETLRPVLDLDAFLAANAIFLSEENYRRVVEGLPETLAKVIATLTDRARGDYSDDLTVRQFPMMRAELRQRPPIGTETTGIVKTFDNLFDRWKAADKRAASTISTWRGYLARFTKFVGHDDPHRVERVDALRWKDALVAEGLKKISTTYLAALNTLYRFGLSNSETTGVTRNPFDGVKAPQKVAAGTKRLPFSRAEVALILNAARKENLAHLRWIPWLQAQTGSRVAEIAQLWAHMVITDDAGNPCLNITTAPDGGSLKNQGSERIVPLHPDIIADGFLEFVKTRGKGPLFYGGSKGKAAVQVRDDQKHPSKGVSNRVGTWVRGLGITDPRKGPTHSFRHWFKSELPRKSGCDSRLVDIIQGHSPETDAAGYRHAEISEMLEAISKLDLNALAENDVRREET